MPRQDVPYPTGAICRLRERIGELFDLLGQKLHSINGVEGDGQGNVTITSGDPAIVINNDAAQHEIEIDLDSSQLPAAAVSSVNGATGAVVLNADDIPSDGSSDVQADIDALKLTDTGLNTAIGNEATARANADSTLQTNINTVTASLPAAAAAAVAADPTVAQLVTDMAGKVDLTDVSTVETPDTIAKRNGSGRLVAADPASGATDKTLVTANWVSQTGSGAPNNLVHKNGNETINGTITHKNEIRIEKSGRLMTMLCTGVTIGNNQTTGALVFEDSQSSVIGSIYFNTRTNGTTEIVARVRNGNGTFKDITIGSGNP